MLSYKLAGWKVSVVAMSGMTFELDTPHGRMMATMLAGIAQFESDLFGERVKSGLAAARARGKKLGRQPGSVPSQSGLLRRYSMPSTAGGATVVSPATSASATNNTVTDIVKRHRANPYQRRISPPTGLDPIRLEAPKSVGSNGETVFRLKGERAFEVDVWTFNRRCRLL